MAQSPALTFPRSSMALMNLWQGEGTKLEGYILLWSDEYVFRNELRK